MDLPIEQPDIATLPNKDNKKIYIILGGIGLIAIILIPLMIGLLTPTKKVETVIKPAKSISKTITQTQITPKVSPIQSIANQTEKISPQQNINNQSYSLTPQPTTNLDDLLPTIATTPTPTPLPGPFYTANGRQNDLYIRLYKVLDGDQTYQVQLINSKTHEVRIIGYAYEASPGDSSFFNKDFSQVIFLGGKKNDNQNISFYSIPNNTIIKSISLNDMKDAVSSLPVQPTAVLSRMVASPDGTRVIISYGITYNINRIDPLTYILLINLQTKKIRQLPIYGLAKDWKDNQTIEYETNSSDPNINTVQEFTVPSI